MQPIDQAWMMISSILPAKMNDKMNNENKYCQLQSRQATINQRPMASASWQYAWKHCMCSVMLQRQQHRQQHSPCCWSASCYFTPTAQWTNDVILSPKLAKNHAEVMAPHATPITMWQAVTAEGDGLWSGATGAGHSWWWCQQLLPCSKYYKKLA